MSIGYVVISVCATMPDRTCAERKQSVPIDYGIMKHLQNIKLPIISFALEVEFSYYLLRPL